ncbi:MAG: nuclear transport factor 2 family protein [Planctomycetota bacterium]
MPSEADVKRELLALNQSLLESIANADWEVYATLCDPSISAFEPEAMGQLVEGMDFHRFYFDLGAARPGHKTTMCSPHVRLMGDVAVLSYVRLNQRISADGAPAVSGVEETRVWQKTSGGWKHVHFHRSPLAK